MSLCDLPTYVPGFRDGINFRDLGGRDGFGHHLIRKGLLYRSGRLDVLTPDEWSHLQALGIKTVFDLRSDDEFLERPDPPLPHARVVHVDARRRLAGIDLPPDASLEDLVADKARATAEMAFGSLALRRLFALLCAEDTPPLLIHCNSGKDRTGVAAMAILMALGADDRTILRDYLLSNAYRQAVIAWSLAQIPHYDQLPPHQQKLLLILQGVIPEVCQTVLDRIDAAYPSRDEYLHVECGLDAPSLEALRSRYLH